MNRAGEAGIVRLIAFVLGLTAAIAVAGCGDMRQNGPVSPTSVGSTNHVLPGGANIRPFDTLTCDIVTTSFTYGTEVCAKATGLGGGFVGTLEWVRPNGTVAWSLSVTGNIQDRRTPDACGTWTLRLTHPRDVGSDVLESTFEVTGCPAASQGCSPGFWKQTQHFGDWPNPPAPSDTFASVFGRTITVNLSPSVTVTGPTLVEAVDANGGGVNRTARIGTAAYLSAVHSGVNYPYSTAQVILAVQQAIDGVAFTGPSIDDLENVWKNVVDHCPLGADPDSGD